MADGKGWWGCSPPTLSSTTKRWISNGPQKPYPRKRHTFKAVWSQIRLGSPSIPSWSPFQLRRLPPFRVRLGAALPPSAAPPRLARPTLKTVLLSHRYAEARSAELPQDPSLREQFCGGDSDLRAVSRFATAPEVTRLQWRGVLDAHPCSFLCFR